MSSITAPVIPPLDFKPEFRGPGFIATPTSPRGFLDVGARDDESVSDRRESFVTALTGPGRESRYSLGQDEVFVDAEEGFRRDSDGTIHPFDPRILDDNTDTPPTLPPLSIPQNSSKPVKPPIPPRIVMHPRSASGTSLYPPSYNHPSGSHSSVNYPQSNSLVHLHRPTPPPIAHPTSRLGVSAPSLNELGSSISTSSSFIDRRFAPSSLYFAPASERESARNRGPRWSLHLDRADTVQVLFWLGFIMPWCWLLGGWVFSPRPPLRGHGSDAGHGQRSHKSLDGGRAPLLPLLANRSKSVYSLDTALYHGYPFVAPSVLSLAPPPPPYQSYRAPAVLTPKPIELERRTMPNPYVRRCRIAAVMSGLLILVALLIALVVVGTQHSI